jgi:sortase (surface protein transpeptidase)
VKLPRALVLATALCLALVGQVNAQEAPLGAGSAPVFIDIPRIGTHAAVVPLAQDDDGTMQAPTDPDVVGWYALGTGLGAPGNALLDGHVDWGGRLRVFGLLRQLAPGDTVQITDDAGQVFSYAVQWTKLYDADSAPLDEIFAASQDEEVTLITCGGPFDQSIHMYVSRWVVRATRLNDSAALTTAD